MKPRKICFYPENLIVDVFIARQLGKSLPKGITRISRWDAPTLSSKQKQYAADDAYVRGFMIEFEFLYTRYTHRATKASFTSPHDQASFAVYQAINERRQPSSKDTHVKISHLADDNVGERYKQEGEYRKSKATTSITDTTTDTVEEVRIASVISLLLI